MRPVGVKGALVRFYGVPLEPVSFAAPAGVAGVAVRDGGRGVASLGLDGDRVTARFQVGEHLLEWARG